MTAKSDVVTHYGTISVENATLTLEGTFIPSSNDAQAFITSIESGGTLNILGRYRPFFARTSVKAGGVLVLNPTKFDPWNNDVTFDIAGELSLPGGLACETAGTMQESKAVSISLKDGGRLVVGGKVAKTGVKGALRFSLGGGTVVATDDVAFDNIEGSVAENAAIAVEVAEDKTLDLSSFGVLSGATLTKNGAGTVRLGATKFARLSVESGTLAVGSVFPSDDVELADGVTVSLVAGNSTIVFPEISAHGLTLEVAADGIVLGSLPSSFTTVVVDTAKVTLDVPLLSCADADTRKTLMEKIKATLPTNRSVYEQGISLVLTETKDQTFTGGASGTITDWNDPAGWSNGQVPTEGEVAVQGEGVVLDLTATPTVDKIQVSRGAKVRVAGAAVALPTISLAGASELEIASGSANLLKGFTTAASVVGEEALLPTLVVAEGGTLTVPDAMAFKNVALTLHGTLAVDGTSVYLGTAADETAYFEMTADGGKIVPVADPATTGFTYYYLVPMAGGRVRVPSGTITIRNMPETSFAQGATTRVYMGATDANRQNAKDEAIDLVVDNATLFVRNNGSNNSYPGCLGGGVTLRLTNGGAYREWFKPDDSFGTNGRCGGFRLVGNGRIVIEKGSRFVLPEDCTTYFDFSPDSEREVLTMTDAYLHIARTTGNDRAKIRMVGDNILEASSPYWWSMNNGCNAFKGVKELNLEGTDTKLTVVTWNVGTQGRIGPIFRSGAAVTGEGSIVVGSTATNLGENNASWYHDLTILYGISGNTCTGTLRTGSDRTTILLQDGADWAGTLIWNGQFGFGDPTEDTSKNPTKVFTPASVTIGTLKMETPIRLRIVRDVDGNLVYDSLSVTKVLDIADGKGLVELVPQADDFDLGAKESVLLGTFPAGAFTHVTVKFGNRTLKVSETPTEVEGVVTCTAKFARGFQIIIR